MKFIVEMIENIARRAVKNQAIKVMHLIRMNASKFSRGQLRTLERFIENHHELADDYRLKHL